MEESGQPKEDGRIDVGYEVLFVVVVVACVTKWVCLIADRIIEAIVNFVTQTHTHSHTHLSR